VYATNTTLNGIQFIHQPVSQLQASCEAAEIFDVRQDGNYREFGVCYFSENVQMMWWVVEGRVFKLDLLPQFDTTGIHPCWPVP
jgi:hypothetical protein